MLENLSLINFLIYAMALGFAIAMIYTNIQRTALSKFINALIDNNCYDSGSAMTLKDLGLSGIYATISKSAVKKQFGIKKAVCVIEQNTQSNDKLEAMLDSSDDENRYYLFEDCDKELLLKRYNYETLSAKHMTLFLLALVATVFVAVFAVNLIIKNASVKKIDESTKPESEIIENVQDITNEESGEMQEEPDEDVTEVDENSNPSTTPVMPVSY